MTAIDVQAAREALAGLPEETSYGDEPELARVYLPPSHVKAMDPNVALVKGMRGAGKTFWWTALQQPNVRRLVRRSPWRTALDEKTRVGTGFGVTPSPDDYPGKDTLRSLTVAGTEPRTIWRTVLARQLAADGHPVRRCRSWADRTKYVADNPEDVERLFHERDRELDREGIYFLFLFDALDRCADDWKDMYRAIRGLMQTALDMRAYRRLRVKAFLRSDQVDEEAIADFPDASKILSSASELHWPRRELYGLLWHLLANGSDGDLFRDFFGGEWGMPDDGSPGLFPIPRTLVNEDDQRAKFHVLTGQWMGTDRRRGFPYTWIVNHLGDTEGRVSPRSFLAALKTAAEDTAERHSEHRFAVHYDSIKSGVQTASRIRVRELQEDYPWVHRVMTPLAGMLVPCRFREIATTWRNQRVLAGLEEAMAENAVKLPPSRIERGADGVREDLESLGIFSRLSDDRVNIPDVFRVAYRLGRRGGVKPVG